MEVTSRRTFCRGCEYAFQSSCSECTRGIAGLRSKRRGEVLRNMTVHGSSFSKMGQDSRCLRARGRVMPGSASVLPGNALILPGSASVLPGSATVMPRTASVMPGRASVMPGALSGGDLGPSPEDNAGMDVGVVVVDHGSKRAEANAMLEEFVKTYKAQTGRTVVEVAHMEIASPSIADAVSRCVAAGSRRVVVAPYFLSRGRHIQTDIPALVAEAAAQHPGIVCTVADPIGIDPLLVDIIDQRVKNALGEGCSHSSEH